jgi:hypothetical protein
MSISEKTEELSLQTNKPKRKTVPKGKKRVMKTRTYIDDKDYMVTEEYSDYEDVDPNEVVAKKKPAAAKK